MKRSRIVAFVLLALVGMALALPVMVSLDAYRPEIERQAAERLKEPVSIGKLRFALLPLPSVTLAEIAIGSGKEVRVGSVQVHPGLLSLFSKVKVIGSVEVSGIKVNKALMDRLPKWTKPEPGPATVLVQRIVARDVHVDLDGFAWGPLRADVRLGESGLRELEAGTEDRHLLLEVKPRGEAFDVEIKGKQWKLPIKPAIEFQALDGKGTLAGSTLDLTQVTGRLYGGEMHANTRIDWKDGIRIKGDARAADVEIEPIVRLLSQSASMSGKLHASGGYALNARNAGQLADSLRGKFKVEVKKGVLHNFDLASAVRSLAKSGTRGGQTAFDQLSTNVNLVGKSIQLRDIKVGSGALKADGNVDIAASRSLAGLVYVEMAGTGGLLRVPLDVSGTLQSPVLFPNRAALAGAAAGTGLMGPGFGTSAGAKAGEFLDKLFK